MRRGLCLAVADDLPGLAVGGHKALYSHRPCGLRARRRTGAGVKPGLLSPQPRRDNGRAKSLTPALKPRNGGIRNVNTRTRMALDCSDSNRATRLKPPASVRRACSGRLRLIGAVPRGRASPPSELSYRDFPVHFTSCSCSFRVKYPLTRARPGLRTQRRAALSNLHGS